MIVLRQDTTLSLSERENIVMRQDTTEPWRFHTVSKWRRE
jgi:hypothetical protein